MKQQTQINKIEWKEIALGEIFDFENKTGIKAGEGLEKGKYKFFTSSDNQSKFLDKFNFDGEHLIFSTGGKAGLHYCNEPFSVSNDCFIVKVKGHSTKLIYYLLKSKIYLLEKGFKGAGLKHLSKDYLKRIKVKLPFMSDGTPDLKEQEKIVSILEKNEGQLKKVEKTEKLLNEYLKCVFYELFGSTISNDRKYPLKKLKDVCFKITDGTHKSPPNSEQGDYPYVTAKNIKKNGLDLTNLTYISKAHHMEIYKRCNPEKGDVLYIKDGATTGIAVINNLEFEFSLLSSVALLKPSKDLETIYLTHYLNDPQVYHLIRNSMGGVAITRLTLKKIEQIKIPLPPLPLQQKFAKVVEQIEEMKENLNQTKQNAKELFNSLMSKAFKGEL